MAGGFYALLWAFWTPRRMDPALPFVSESSYRNLVAHLSESVLEDFALGRLSKYRVEETHVRCCRECRERLDTEIGVVALMRAAAAKIRGDGPSE